MLREQPFIAGTRHNVRMNTTGTVRFEESRSSFKSWTDLFSEAAAFATTLGRERLISISYYEDQRRGILAVWYWG